MKHILIIDDDPQFRRALKDRLSANKYEVTEAGNGQDGLEQIEAEFPHVVLLDLRMPGLSGMKVLSHITTHYPNLPVIILTAHGTIEKAVEAMKAGAMDFLLKPCDPQHVLLVIEKVIQQQQMKTENQLLREEVNKQHQMIIGSSQAMQRVMEVAGKIAATDSTVLIEGESGTGKQLMARTLHQMSLRRDTPFVQVNCTTLTEQLLESDLFGHESGAFTGAKHRKRGRVELAHGGTLFLDEIGDLAPALQAKLLHFLEYGEFERVGGMKTLTVDTRIITATNRILSDAVEDHTFRADLYYRLNVLKIQLPPLRERMEDFETLVNHFTRKYATSLGKPIPKMSDEAMAKLREYHWPGNIRELANAIERAIVLGTGAILGPDLFPQHMFQTDEQEVQVGQSLEEAMHSFKRQFIAKTLQANDNNQTQAASVLEIQRTYLNRLIKELSIQTNQS